MNNKTDVAPSEPPCAHWDIWEGPEVEGRDSIGAKTLFVRRGKAATILRLAKAYARVWFCAEYQEWDIVQRVLEEPGCEVCLEVTPQTEKFVPVEVLYAAKIYYKTSVPLKVGDHIAVGGRFEEELFRVGDGAKVKPTEYLGDKRIK
jgi:hypothetical protein